MKLLDEIIELASTENTSVATLLRKCLILANALQNQRLKEWAESELSGYSEDKLPLPDYRKFYAHAKGQFIGPMGGSIDGQPLPDLLLKEEHRHFATTLELRGPIVEYETRDDSKNT